VVYVARMGTEKMNTVCHPEVGDCLQEKGVCASMILKWV
jgi:hypothetical protein